MHVGIVGTGKMGSALLKLLASTPYHITVLTRSADKAEKSRRKYFKKIDREFKRGGISEEKYNHIKAVRKFTHKIEELAGCQLVIESIVEDFEAKTSLFRKLESVVNKDAILATNTSAIPISNLAEKLLYKNRFCGLHFFHPVFMMNLVEIIRRADTQPRLIELVKDFSRQIGKKPIVVLDGPGSVLNIILVYYYLEAFYILESGLALPLEIDKLAKQYFYTGPCESVDTIGIDLFVTALKIQSRPDSICPVRWTDDPLEEVDSEKSGGRKGFYVPHLFRKLIAENHREAGVAKGVYDFEDKPGFYLNETGMTSRVTSNASRKEKDLIAKRLLYALFNGAIDAVQKGMSSVEELDTGLKEVLWMNQGPFAMMKKIGREKVQEDFDYLLNNVGKRFTQTALSL